MFNYNNSINRIKEIEEIVKTNEEKVIKEKIRLQNLYTSKQLSNFISKTDELLQLKKIVNVN